MLNRKSIFVVLGLLVASSGAQAQSPSSNPSSYTVRSATQDEIIVEVNPVYTITQVRDEKSGAAFTNINLEGGVYATLQVGAPGVMELPLPIITPTSEPAYVTISNEEYETLGSIALAPVPKLVSNTGTLEPHYIADATLYQNVNALPITTAKANGTFRNAFTGSIVLAAVRYNSGGSVRILKHAVLHIRFSKTGRANPSTLATSRNEREMFATAFLNGSVAEFYHAAEATNTRGIQVAPPSKEARKALGAGERWVSVETNETGVYRITAQDLAGAGVSGTIDTAALHLYGTGGTPLSEQVNPSTGELRECAIEVHANSDGSLRDFYFFAPGNTSWHYSNGNTDKLYSFYHTINPYFTGGHYLVRVSAGASQGLRVQFQADTALASTTMTSVLSVTVQEDEKNFEHPSVSREFVGNRIPADGSSLQVSVQSPGFAPNEWSWLRVGFDAFSITDYSVGVDINGQAQVGIPGPTVPDDDNVVDDPPVARSWGKGYVWTDPNPVRQVTLAAHPVTGFPTVWLNWLEYFYHRSLSIGNSSIPFFVIDTNVAFQYNFDQASGGELWDIGSDQQPIILARETGGGSMPSLVHGVRNQVRQLIAFSQSSVLSPRVSSTSAPLLRSTIGLDGAEDIIIAPSEFLDQANALKALRTQGGQATEPLKTVVVSLEDIYHDFGYGSHDVTAIRDFMAFMFRHTTANKTTVPLFLTLFGAGHADYQNRVTSTPMRIPVFEYGENSLSRGASSGPNEIIPDDGYFGRLTNSQYPDVGVGRLSVQTEDDANTIVDKLKHYELASAQGPWRSIATFTCDDRQYKGSLRDPLASDHIHDTEGEIKEMGDRLLVHKIYEVNYPIAITTSGLKRPASEEALVSAINGGTVLLSFIGHGNPTVWTHENLLSVPSTIKKMTNYDQLTFFTTATCDFSVFDNYNQISGGVQLLLKPDGGAISLLGTCRPVYSGEPLVQSFYHTLFGVPCDQRFGTAHIGSALVASKIAGSYPNAVAFFILGDPALRLLVPRQYVVIDTINSIPVSETNKQISIPSLTQMRVTGMISNTCDGASPDASFNGTATLTLLDADIAVSRTSTFSDSSPETDHFNMEGPILYRGASTVKNGRFVATFIIPKDVKVDTNNARMSILAYSNDNRSALGVNNSLVLTASDTNLAVHDTVGPKLQVFIGARSFLSGDTVSVHSNIIVDVQDLTGLNTSTASVGHSFIAWVDDSTNGAVDMAENYEAKQDDYTSGTSIRPSTLPVGKHTLHVRAFDAVDNAATAQVDFIARDNSTAYRLYDVKTWPNPMKDHISFSFMQPGNAGDVIDVALHLFTTDGRNIRHVADNGITDNTVIVTWDGRDDGNQIVSNGAYIYTIQVTDRTTGDTANLNGEVIVIR
ncbi:MAG: type IX secretion system sortase PorU [Candidatus Kapaibacterium sp.]